MTQIRLVIQSETLGDIEVWRETGTSAHPNDERKNIRRLIMEAKVMVWRAHQLHIGEAGD